MEQVGAQAPAVSEPGICMTSGPFSRLWLLSHPELGLRTPRDAQGQLVLGEDGTLTLPFEGRAHPSATDPNTVSTHKVTTGQSRCPDPDTHKQPRDQGSAFSYLSPLVCRCEK